MPAVTVVACLGAGLWGCDRSPAPSAAPPTRPSPPSTSSTAADADAASAEWHTFEGSWNAAGSRRTIGLGADRSASILDLRGTMLLTGTDRPGVGFRAEVIALTDTETGLAGRGVWTDEHGDRVFSELKGEGTRENNHITGTILGGTGRYSGVTGGYEFSWQFVIESEDGSIQGRAVGLKGRFRAGQPEAGATR